MPHTCLRPLKSVAVLLSFFPMMCAPSRPLEAGSPPDILWYQRGVGSYETGSGATMALSADGRLIALAANGLIRGWRVSDGQPLYEVTLPVSPVTDSNITYLNTPTIAFSPDGRYLAYSLIPQHILSVSIHILDARNGTPVRTIERLQDESLYRLQFSADGEVLAGIFRDKDRLWRVSDGQKINEFPSQEVPARFRGFSPGPPHLAVLLGERKINYENVPDSAHILRITDGQILSKFRFGDRTLRSHLPYDAGPFFSSGGRVLTIATSTNSQITFSQWRVSDGLFLGKTVAEGPIQYGGRPAHSPDGSSFALGGAVFRVDNGTLIRSLELPTDYPYFSYHSYNIALSNGGSVLAAYNLYSREVRVWDVREGTVQFGTLWKGTHPLAFSPTGRYLLTSRHLLRGSDGYPLYTLPLKSPRTLEPRSPWSGAFSKDEQFVAVGTGVPLMELVYIPGGCSSCFDPVNALWLIRTEDGTLAHRIGLTGPGYGSAFSPDGETLAVAVGRYVERGSTQKWGTDTSRGWDSKVELYNISDGQLIRSLGPFAEDQKVVQYSPDGSLLAAGGSGSVTRIWRVADGTLLHTLRNSMLGSINDVRSLRFSPDHKEITVSHAGDGLRRWNIEREEIVQRILSGNAYAPPGLNGYISTESGKLVFRTMDQQTLKAYDERVKGLRHLTISPDGRFFAYFLKVEQGLDREKGELIVAASPLVPRERTGDLNRDGSVNVSDALLSLRIIVGLIEATDSQAWEADLNGDGHVNVADTVAILKRLVGLPQSG